MEWFPGRVRPGEGPKKLSSKSEDHEQGLRLIGMYDGDKQWFFEGETDRDIVNAFLNEVLTAKNAEKWIFAHYGGMADMQFILRVLVEKGGAYQVSASFSGSSAIIVKVTRGELTWTFCDSFWLLRDRLARLGASVGIPKLTEHYICDNFPACGHVDPLEEEIKKKGNGRCLHYSDHHFVEMGDDDVCEWCGEVRHQKSLCLFFAPMNKLKEYNAQDCLILYRAIKQFEEVLLDLGGELQMTIASCAMRLFRRRYLKEDIKNKGPGLQEINDIARMAYTSSRVEVFQKHCPSDAFVKSVEAQGFHQCRRKWHFDGVRESVSGEGCFNFWKLLRFPHAEEYPFLDSKGKIYEQYEDWGGPPLCPQCVLYASKVKVDYYDLNSSFPYAGTFPMPGNLKRRLPGKLPKNRNAIFLADVTIKVQPQYLPPIPYRHKDRVFFPFGQWRAWMSSVDLELLEDTGGQILHVHESIEFYPQDYLAGYMTDVYDKRKNAKSAYEKLILKYLLNSLYGKFSERPEKKSMVLYPKTTACPHDGKHKCEKFPYCEHAERGDDCAACMEMLFPGCWIVTSESDVQHEWVPIGVHLTAIARRNLYEYMHHAQGDVYYVDTDSCVTTTKLPSDPKTLGMLKWEKSIWDGEFVAPKLYSTLVADADEKEDIGKDKVRAKGFSRVTYERFCAITEGEAIRISRMTRSLELFRKAGRVSSKTDFEAGIEVEPEEAIVEKRLVQKQRPKRKPLEDGQTRPWAVHEIQSDREDSSIVILPDPNPRMKRRIWKS